MVTYFGGSFIRISRCFRSVVIHQVIAVIGTVHVQITKVVGNALIPFFGGAWLTAQNGWNTVVACARRYASALGDAFSSTVNDFNQFISRENQPVG